MIEYIIGFMLLTYFVFVLVGLIYMTYGIFTVTEDSIPGETSNAVLVDYVTKKAVSAEYTQVMKDAELAKLPMVKTEIKNGKFILQLGGTERTVCQISMISLFVFIIIGILFAIFAVIN